jgi:S1-C subfamily serine protease
MGFDSDDNALGLAVESMLVAHRVQLTRMRLEMPGRFSRHMQDDLKGYPRFYLLVRSTDLDICLPEGSRQLHFHVEVMDLQANERLFLMRGEYGCKDTLVANLQDWTERNLDMNRTDLVWFDPVPNERLKEDKWARSGSGFFISTSGHLVTNAHVVEGASQVVVSHKGIEFPASVVKQDNANDLAILKVEGAFPALPIGPSRLVKLGSAVATIGFPNSAIQGSSPKLSRGEVASMYGIKDDVRHFQVSAPIQPGSSGGPLFDMQGNVIGVIVAKLNPLVTLGVSGSLPENVNYAVKSSYLMSFIESIPALVGNLPSPSTKEATFTEVVEQVTSAAVMVVARK